jgi:hypothetical protein
MPDSLLLGRRGCTTAGRRLVARLRGILPHGKSANPWCNKRCPRPASASGCKMIGNNGCGRCADASVTLSSSTAVLAADPDLCVKRGFLLESAMLTDSLHVFCR